MRKKALIVEDDINIAELLKIYLQKDGFEVVNVYDGGRAVALAETFRPDILLSTSLHKFKRQSSAL